MYRGIGVILALTACLGWSVMAGAAVYRWVDQHGEVHYSDVPATGAQSIDTRTWKAPQSAHHTPPAAAVPASQGADQNAPMSRADKCNLAQKQFGQYKNASKLIERDQFGAKHTLDDKERAQLVKQAKANVDKYCGAAVVGS